MGLIVSRFRKKKTSEELLEDIQKNIEKIENDSKYILKREKAILFRLIFVSVLIYITSALLFYYFFPSSLWERLFYMASLIVFPIIILFLRKLIKWLYDRDMRNSTDKLKDLMSQKRKILDDVKNTETYKKAKEILDKYEPEKKILPPTIEGNSLEGIQKVNSENRNKKNEEFQKLVSRQVSNSIRIDQRYTMKIVETSITNPLNTSVLKTPVPIKRESMTPLQSRNLNTPGKMVMMNKMVPSMQQTPLRPRLPRPLISQDRNYIDRFIEILVGDGPSNRYALICKACSSHNGMALKEEFEYLSFRCAYCGTPNPSRKVKPREMPPGFTPLRQIEGPRNEGERSSPSLNDESRRSSSADARDSSREGSEREPSPENAVETAEKTLVEPSEEDKKDQ